MSNKAHTATVNRIAHRYGIRPTPDGPFDLQTENLIIEVETSASLDQAIEKLQQQTGPVYIAVTNKEGLHLALTKTEGTVVGVMDPKGDIVRGSGDYPPP